MISRPKNEDSVHPTTELIGKEQVKHLIKSAVESPAVVLDKTIEVSEKIVGEVQKQQPIKKAREFWKMLGPGLTTGAADDDPSGIATYSQTGARYGFQLIWLAAFTFPLMAVVQEMCARLGLVTGRGLASNIRRHFPHWVLYVCTVLLFMANSFNIGADLGAMAKSTQLLLPEANFGLLIIFFAALCLGMQIFMSYGQYAKYLKYLALVLLSYVFTAFVIPNLDWQVILHAAFVPSLNLSPDQLLIITAVLGTTISPYLFFWQTSQEVEEQILQGETTVEEREAKTSNEQIKKMRIDIWSGMFLSNIVMFFIIAVTAGTLFSNGITNIETAEQAASALRPLAGDGAYLLFTIGILGTGLLAIPVLAGSAAYGLSESFGWRSGLFHKLREAHAFYGVIILSTLVGFTLNFIGLDPIKTLIYSAVANGLVAPIVLILIVLLSSNPKIMGNRTNHPITQSLGWLITIIMTIAGLATLYTLFS